MIEGQWKDKKYMNVLFFLTPKSEAAHLHDDWTLRQAIEKLERSGMI